MAGSSVSRGTYAIIDLAALRSNYQTLRRLAAGTKVLAVVKADAYGHGLIQVARALPESDGFGVAILEEAICLREAGVLQPIVLLEGAQSATEMQRAAEHQIAVVVHQKEQIDYLEQITLREPVDVWLKFNTGMHRLGLELGQVDSALARLHHNAQVRSITLMSHFACADDVASGVTAEQAALFHEVCSRHRHLGVQGSLSNSAGMFRGVDYHYDWVRPGLALYGASPLLEASAQELGLKPVMQLCSRIIALRTVQPGDTVGYGAAWQAQEPATIGIVGIGYGDGYPRHVDENVCVLVGGCACPLAGRVSMDMIAVDVSQVGDVKLGDPVILWGPELPIENVASSAGTINYELLCQVTHRAERIYRQ